jgi:hypothetical protein
MNKFFITLFSALFLLLGACKTKKVVSLSEPTRTEATVKSAELNKANLVGQIVQRKNGAAAFSFIAEADYFDGKQSITLNMDVSAKKDQYIYLNAKALGFVNVARVMLQPDSIRILDLVNRKYISASYQFMKNFTQANLGFKEMQNLVWANAFYDPQVNKSKLDSLGQQFILWLDLGSAQQKATYNTDFVLQSVLLNEQAKSQQMQVDFANFKNIDGMSYPHEVVINISGEKKVECKFAISNFAGSIKKEPQFVIPKSYKVQVY